MRSEMILTVIGPDRPGLVDQLSQVIADQEGNWLESAMSRLGGQFAGIVRIECPTKRVSSLSENLAALKDAGLQVVLHAEPISAPQSLAGALIRLEVVGQDRPGIVRRIAHALAEEEVNVEELTTATESAPMSGEILFRASARLQVPEECDLALLQRKLEEIAADLLVDLHFQQDR